MLCLCHHRPMALGSSEMCRQISCYNLIKYNLSSMQLLSSEIKWMHQFHCQNSSGKVVAAVAAVLKPWQQAIKQAQRVSVTWCITFGCITFGCLQNCLCGHDWHSFFSPEELLVDQEYLSKPKMCSVDPSFSNKSKNKFSFTKHCL